MHALLVALITLGDGTLGKTGLHFVILLDKGTAWAPVSGTAIAHAASLDTESLTDLASLHHRKNPTAASEALNETKEHAVAVKVIRSLHGRVVHSIGGLSVKHAWQKGTEQARRARRAIAEAGLPFLVLDILSLAVRRGLGHLQGHCD